jgi:hypothetical protein
MAYYTTYAGFHKSCNFFHHKALWQTQNEKADRKTYQNLK